MDRDQASCACVLFLLAVWGLIGIPMSSTVIARYNKTGGLPKATCHLSQPTTQYDAWFGESFSNVHIYSTATILSTNTTVPVDLRYPAPPELLNYQTQGRVASFIERVRDKEISCWVDLETEVPHEAYHENINIGWWSFALALAILCAVGDWLFFLAWFASTERGKQCIQWMDNCTCIQWMDNCTKKCNDCLCSESEPDFPTLPTSTHGDHRPTQDTMCPPITRTPTLVMDPIPLYGMPSPYVPRVPPPAFEPHPAAKRPPTPPPPSYSQAVHPAAKRPPTPPPPSYSQAVAVVDARADADVENVVFHV